MSTEKSLADAAADTTPKVEPKDFDTDAFLAGVRLPRRAVKIRPNLHLLATIERLNDEIESAPESTSVDALIDEYETVKPAYLAYEWWEVEQRAPERRELIRTNAAKALGIKLDKKLKPEDAARLGAAVIADHIVTPSGVTPEHVAKLGEASPSEATKLTNAIEQVQWIVNDETDRAVLRDFSSRRSAKGHHS